MYEVFINDVAIIFSEKPLNTEKSIVMDKISDLGNTAEYIVENIKDNGYSTIWICSNNYELEWNRFKSLFRFVEAAGGLVKDTEGAVLCIFRNGKWDLPKGHCEPSESKSQTAEREVVEECGKMSLQVGELLIKTYHCYLFKSKWRLKETWWFEMQTDKTCELSPQLEEGIELVEFRSKSKLNEVHQTTYPNIKRVLDIGGFSFS